MDGGYAPCSGLTLVPARTHSGAVALTSPHAMTIRRGRESLQEACGSGRRCSSRPPPVKPSTIPCSPDLVPFVGSSEATWGSRQRLCMSASWDFNYRVRLRFILSLYQIVLKQF